MLVFYFLQGELGESMERPNAFVAPGPLLTFGEFLQHFPMIDKSSMHFRFRSDDPLFGYVWEDVRDVSKVLPLYEGNVFAKILRIGGSADEKRKIILKRKNFDQSGPVFQNLQSPSNPPRSASVPRPNEETGNSPPPPKPVKPLAKPAATATSVPPPTAPAAAPSVKSPPASEPNFFDTESDSKAAGAYSPPPDILNFDESPFTPASSSAKLKPSTTSSRSPMTTSTSAMDIDDDSGNTSRSGKGGELNRAELAARKEEAIEDKVRSALEFKKEVDQKKEREQAEFDSAKAKHEQALNAWATNNKEKRNVRTLLSTMHTVLPSDSKWKPLGLGDVLEASQVKKAYRRAMLVVHPDHCINLDSEHKFICKRVFEALNEAYDEFTKKENV